jgi:hypothetical protein
MSMLSASAVTLPMQAPCALLLLVLMLYNKNPGACSVCCCQGSAQDSAIQHSADAYQRIHACCSQKFILTH